MGREDAEGRTVQVAGDITTGKALAEAVSGGHKRTALAGGGSSATGVAWSSIGGLTGSSRIWGSTPTRRSFR
jgi:hypothetical protein